ncbi:Leucine-rich repeat serine/threonine-protein kinase 1 [Hondaea fermentalgiana]|uniref:non-specific serine/threonine protein kinase n=1 Tax=Hondaea fermentalgiana TaxID=2315210 RepID=A0A2R5GUH0_9STRA|nr:Leucine-rich repeat serine/threonine-protein kinase 1 [Hondaea fermentalgiana]|eukprot:GBG34516.1 Leucine-rich repeat serine/threonine-protein kinase 1 [Hondaea fermentalgiana]
MAETTTNGAIAQAIKEIEQGSPTVSARIERHVGISIVLRRIAAALKRNQSGPSPPEATVFSDKWLNAVKSAVAEGDQLAWNLAKLMVVGRGAAGKTSTVRSLLGQTPVLEHLSTEMADISRTRAQDWKPVNEDHNDFQTQVRLAASQRLQQNATSEQSSVGVDAALSIARATTTDSDRGLHAGNPGTSDDTFKAETAPESTSRPLQDLQKPLLAPEEVARRFQLRDEDEAFLQRAAPARKVSFSIWDYGGQRVFYALHHIFLTEKGLYLVVFDMRELVGADKFKTDLRPEEYARLGTQDESIDFLRFWLNSIKLHAPGAPVLLVGTHKDKVQDVHAVDCVLRKAEIVSSDCRLVKPNDGLLFFAVDNCSAEGDRASALREAVVSTAVTQAYIHDKVSLAWLKIREDLIKSGKPFVSMEEVVSMGIGYGRTREDVGNMLAYFHELGVVVHLRGSPTLERVVVMDPQWLLNKLARVVADDLHAAKILWDERLGKSGLLQVYKTMRKEAIAPKPLLAWLWDEDEVKYLIEFMEANMLLCPWRFDADSSKEEYLVSALLSVTDQAVDTTRFERGLTCELDFSEFYLPDGIFYRLVAQCAVFATRPEVVEPGLSPRKPKLGTRLAAIYFGLNLFLLEVIKDDVIRLTVSAKAPRPALVIKVLVSMLREQEDTMFRKLPWRLLLLAPGTEKRAEYKIVERAISVTEAKHVWSVDDGDEEPIVVAKFAPFFHEQIGPLDTDEDGPAVPKVKQTLTLGPGMLTHIFLSHKQSSGGDLADMLRLKLENRGLKVWFDQAYNHALNHAAMLEGVRQSRAYVLVLTKGVFSSEAVMTELRCALEIGKPVILVHESETHRESYTPFPHMPSNGIRQNGGVAVARALKQNSTLQVLSAQSTSSGGATTFRPGEGASAASATFTHASPVSSAPTVSPSAYHNPAPSDSQPILVAPEEVARRFRLRAEDTTLLQSAAPERDVSFSIWDYGGQRVFYALHHIFLTSKGLYVVVFDMRELLDVDKLKDKLTPQELAGLATRDESLWFVRFWLNSIKLHAPDASVVLVGTHKDQVDDLEEVDDVLRAAGVVRPDCRLVLPENDLLFFAVDNCSPDVNRAEALRKAVTETATQLDHAHDKVPLAWLKIREDLVESKEPFVPIEEVLAMGATLGQSQTDVRKMLAYFHDVGVVVYLSGSETLERVVVIEPQWLLDKLARVIADDLHARKLWRDRRLRLDGFFEAYERLRARAIASRSLLAWLWGGEEVDYLIEFMEANMLLCPWRFDAESKEGKYLVSALLSLAKETVDTSQFQRGLACELDFSGFYLPDGVFYRLVAQCAVYATQSEVCEPGLKPREPKLGTGMAKIHFGLNCFLLEVLSDDVIRLSVKDTAPRPAFVIKVLVSMLRVQEETMFRKLPWRLLLLVPETGERAEYKTVRKAYHDTKAKYVWSVDDETEEALAVAKFEPFFKEQIGPLDTDEDGDAVPKVKEPPLLGPNLDYHIFLSHKQSSGGDLAGMLWLKLENRGFKVWYDQVFEQVLTHEAMRDGVLRSKAIVLVLTKGVFESNAVQHELQCALEAKKRIVLVHESETHRDGYAPFLDYQQSTPTFCKDLISKIESLPVRRKWYEEDSFLGELVRRSLS